MCSRTANWTASDDEAAGVPYQWTSPDKQGVNGPLEVVARSTACGYERTQVRSIDARQLGDGSSHTRR